MGTGFFRSRNGPHWSALKAFVDQIRSANVLLSCFWNWTLNHVVNCVPSYIFRHAMYRLSGINIGRGASIKLHTWVEGNRITIGDRTTVGRFAVLDGRDNLVLGADVSISPHVHFLTGSHDINSPDFRFESAPILVKDRVWIGTRATILPGVTLGEGSVVAAGAVVTKDVEPYSIVAGIPARRIGSRSPDLKYHLNWHPPFC